MLLHYRGACFMYVCVCQAVTEFDIHQAARNGAKTLMDLRRDLQVSVECGRCASCARKCLKSANEDFSENHKLPIYA